MKTLYVSDLDGTLLRSDARTSDFTNRTINELVGRGMLFSYATARSYNTAHKVTAGLDAPIPLIVYNGAMTVDNADGRVLMTNFFDDSAKAVLDDLITAGIYPIVYSFIGGVQKFSFVPRLSSKAVLDFTATRADDERYNPVEDATSLYAGEVFYFTCIDSGERLAPLYEKYRETHRCVFSEDIYSGEQWLEIMSRSVSKANAVLQLKAHLGCDRVVAFGDGVNDIDMFSIADECYAVGNAVDELKRIATAVIDDNNSDAVARWLLEHYRD